MCIRDSSQAVAWLYGWFGVQEWLARGLSLALSLLALWLLVRLGQRLLGSDAGWWGGLLFAVLPLSVFYGRSIQPESLLLACSALALERGLAWRDHGRYGDLALASGGLTGAVLIKVLPALWLGLPLLWLAWLRYGPALLRRLELWLVAAVVLGLHQTQRAQQFIALVIDGNASRCQIAAIRPASGWQVAPTSFSQGLLMLSEVGLQGCGAGLDRSHMQHQAARLGRQQP